MLRDSGQVGLHGEGHGNALLQCGVERRLGRGIGGLKLPQAVQVEP